MYKKYYAHSIPNILYAIEILQTAIYDDDVWILRGIKEIAPQVNIGEMPGQIAMASRVETMITQKWER